jgi:hypothetical protein
MKKMQKLVDNIMAFIQKRKNTKIVFLGHHKAGTTAISSLLAHGTKLSLSSDPIYTFSPNSSSTLEKLFNDSDAFIHIAEKNPHIFFQKVVKEPDYVLSMETILNLYPHSDFVFIARDPHKIIRSILNRLSIDGKTTLQKIPCDKMFNYTPSWDYIINGDPKINDSFSVIERLAHRVEKTTLAYIRYSDNILLIKYEDFLQNKSKSISDLADKLDLIFYQNIDNLVDKQFQPKGDNKLPIKEFFDEENYDLIKKICNQTITHFKY